jgi:AcrR family transcriptional regulator
MAKPMRADARRNYERLVAEAKTAFLEQGTNASLEDIARRSRVGIGTLYRHFPCRIALIDAVYQEEVDKLVAYADELADAEDPFEGLAEWLRAVLRHASTYRGLAASLMESEHAPGAGATMTSCKVPMRKAGGALLARAQQAGLVREDTNIPDLLQLTHVIGLAAEKTPDDPEIAERLLTLTLDGLRFRRVPPGDDPRTPSHCASPGDAPGPPAERPGSRELAPTRGQIGDPAGC